MKTIGRKSSKALFQKLWVKKQANTARSRRSPYWTATVTVVVCVSAPEVAVTVAL